MIARRASLVNCFLKFFFHHPKITATTAIDLYSTTKVLIFEFLRVKKREMTNRNLTNFGGIDIEDWRKPYHNEEEPFLLEENLPSKNPFEVFDVWFKNVAQKNDASFEEINAVCFSTAINNQPRSRMVLMKSYGEEGFCFYTHYNSAKGMEIDKNPYGCMLFYWPRVDRQIRVEGRIEKLPVHAAETYWYHRPLKSRIGSKLSEQSKIIPNRKYLEDKKKELEELAAKSGEEAITRPDDWGGYRLLPNYFEFWQGQSDRIHDRIIFEQEEGGTNKWSIKRLSP